MLSKQEQRHIYYGHDLKIEAYQLSGIVQKFPNHFHEYYVIGFIKGGRRHLQCKGQEYDLASKDMILFNPHDNHFCAPINDELLDYRAVNINKDIMQKMVYQITGQDYLPYFKQNVVYQCDISTSIDELYHAIVHQADKLKKEETFFFLLEQILKDYSAPFQDVALPQPRIEIQYLCDYMNEHYQENINLDDLCSMTHFSQSYLLRTFTKQVGISPYRYLQTIRIDQSKKLLESGIPPVEVAHLTGFSDQSHFTNFFKEFIGITPKQYQNIFKEGDEDE